MQLAAVASVDAAIQGFKAASVLFTQATAIDISTAPGVAEAYRLSDQAIDQMRAGVLLLKANEAKFDPAAFGRMKHHQVGGSYGTDWLQWSMVNEKSLGREQQENVKMLLGMGATGALMGADLLAQLPA